MDSEVIWNYEEFRTYLLLYAANADLEFAPEEEAAILKTISKESYEKVKRAYEHTNDYEHIQTILKYKGLYFPTAEQTKELLDLIVNMFQVDGNFSILERNCIMLLKKMM